MIHIEHSTKINPTMPELFQDGIAQLWQRYDVLLKQDGQPMKDLPFLGLVIRLHEIGASLGMSEIEVGRTIEKKSSPGYLPREFNEAMRVYVRLVKTLGEEHTETRKAFVLAMALAPDWFIDDVSRKHGDLLPKPSGYLEDGTSVVALSDLAKHVGVPVEDVALRLQELMTVREEVGLSNDGFMEVEQGEIHRVQ